MSLVPNSQYKIFNAKFPTQDADLLDGMSTAAVTGYISNSNSFNMVWNLNMVAGAVDQFTLTNAAPSAKGAYASVDETKIGAKLHGSTEAATWTILPATQVGQYWILAPAAVNSSIPSGLVWSLASNRSATPITLAEIAVQDPSQVWTFHPQAGNVGNTAMELDALD